MKRSPINRRIAARLHQAQLDLTDWTDALSARMGAIYGRALQQCVEAAAAEHPQHTRERVHVAINQAHRDAYVYLDEQFTKRVHASHDHAADVLLQTVPVKWWRKVLPPQLAESMDVLQESPFDASDELEPVRDGSLSREEAINAIREALFPSLDRDTVARIVNSPGANGITWPERMEMLTKLADPDTIARHLEDGISAGENTAELRERIRPDVNMYAPSAQRIARTEGRRVALEAQQETFRAAGDLISGMQIMATMDQFTRPEHAEWNGRVYDRQDDGSFRDKDGEELPTFPAAPNCRCLAVPVLAEPSEIQSDPAVAADFANAAGEEIPDPAAYTEWFAGASEPARQEAVGKSRYVYMVEKLKAYAMTPAWNDFLQADSGGLMPLKALKAETAKEHVERRASVDKLLLDRQMQFIKVAQHGFLPSPPPVLDPEVKRVRETGRFKTPAARGRAVGRFKGREYERTT